MLGQSFEGIHMCQHGLINRKIQIPVNMIQYGLKKLVLLLNYRSLHNNDKNEYILVNNTFLLLSIHFQ